ncbi:acyl-CoA dehydrogenase [Mycobacterium branderi]|uniref:Acyl-CoA dehydrogenase n=1 Tax=Mycobacterium branderi TaxID=43348 RepID=A0AA91LU79_9MYCO|nr:acyl-CoA dehydrogenase family protein [Mycobacterium branderi]MCV7234483.1 acyl-CoA/acyl-ACP dehydrogenase [Mycobacterium branderi]ORA34093.1 acyl-CoA dehydrogenase [Mycobacterium branderi]
MRALTVTADTPAGGLDNALLSDIAAHAAALDLGEESSRRSFAALGEAGLLGLGAPGNTDGRLPAMAAVIGEIAAECMSTAFSVWANRMVVEYLLTAETAYSTTVVQPLLRGQALGVTAMASAFKDAAGCGALELRAASVEGGYELYGPIRWASNLYPDSLLVTAARGENGEKLVAALPLDTPGITVGDQFDLLALGCTASSYLKLKGVRIATEQVLSTDFAEFISTVRPTFLVLQSAMCLGLASTALQQGRLGLAGVNSVFAAEVDSLAGRLALAETTLASFAAAVGTPSQPTKKDLLSLRLDAAEIASASAALEIRTAGGKGYASRTSASRRYREAAFIPVQSPSEAQLRWELGRCA